MRTSLHRSPFLFAGCALVCGTTIMMIPALARPVPGNLANGLDKLVENNLIQQGKITTAPAQTVTASSPTKNGKTSAGKTTATTISQTSFDSYKASVAKEAAKYGSRAVTQISMGKCLVDIMPNGRVPLATLQPSLQTKFPALSVTAVDSKYIGHGVIEGYVSLDDVPTIAQSEGVGSVILQLRPIHRVGAVTEHGIHQHRVNRINTIYNPAATHNYDGTGMQIGVLSDSFDSQPSEEGGFTTAAQDVASGDLPGTGNTVNSQPVVVLQDFISPPSATNEGRGMCQIVHDMAPKARIGFATADTGEVGFANNIRALGGLPGFTYPSDVQQGFNGDVVCDDVLYIDEPMFQDGIVAQGVIDVVNAGKTYCSSAGNDWGTDGYASVYRPVADDSGPNHTKLTAAAGNTALAGTNINLSGVDPALYAGGFHNFNPNGLDVAQTVNTGDDAGFFIFQWNDPYDTSAPNLIEPPIFEGNGTSTAGSEVSFGPFQFTQGNLYVVTENATPSLPTDNFDAIVRITDSHGKVWVDQDTGVDETVFFFAPTTDNYTITVHPFAQQPPAYTQGPFHIKINGATNVSGITQDFNCLFFDTAGNFISALDTNSFVNNRPYELLRPTFNADGFTQIQMLVSRSNTTAPANAANQLKCAWLGNGLAGVGPAEYNDYLTPITFGHSAAAGANCIAAYDVFHPNIPEDFTSPGPVTIYFDANNNRLPAPQVRLKPDIAAADGSNNTFFPIGPAPGLVDSQFDPDDYPNFYGTSAASPHAASLAALVLQAHGGPGSLTPQQVKTLLQLTAFPHDLDPFVATGTATASNGGTVSITARSDNSRNTGTGSNDPNTFTVSYNGAGRVATLNFNPEATPDTGGNPTGGNNKSNPTGNLPQDYLNPANYSYTPGLVWTSTYLFGTSVGLVAGDVVHTRSNPAPFPSNQQPDSSTAHEWTLNFTFPNNNFTNGKLFRFNNGRLQWQDATVPQGLTRPVFTGRQDYSADMLGSGVLLPEYADAPVIKAGMTFNGTIVDGANTIPFSGRLTNNIGHGYSVLDGYGFINAEAATTGLLPVPGVVSRKTHGVAGTFDIPLPINGSAGVECRLPGPNNSYTLVYTFDRPVANSGTASIQGTASIAPASGGGTNPSIASNPNQVVVNLTGVTNKQHLVVTLSNVRDTSGNVFPPTAGRMDVLTGDVTNNRIVTTGDVTAVQGQVGATVTQATCRYDVNGNGLVTTGDVTTVQGQVGSTLP
jgi:subtilase family protein